MDHVFTYDTTLRDGEQCEGISLSLEDKLLIARKLDAFGIDYIEGGFPASNPKDIAFFKELAAHPLQHAKLAAFGNTCKKGVAASEDAGLRDLVESGARVATIVGKSWDEQVTRALQTTLEENIRMIGDSVSYLKSQGMEVAFDAEHFFDGYRANPAYAMDCVRAAPRRWRRLHLPLRDQRRNAAVPGGRGPFASSSMVSLGSSSASIATTTPDAPWPTRWAPCPAECGRCRAPRSTGYGRARGQHRPSHRDRRPRAEDGVRRSGGARSAKPYRGVQLRGRGGWRVGACPLPLRRALRVRAQGRPACQRHSALPARHASTVNPDAVGNGTRMVVSELAGKASLLQKAASMGFDVSGDGDDLRHTGHPRRHKAPGSRRVHLRGGRRLAGAAHHAPPWNVQARLHAGKLPSDSGRPRGRGGSGQGRRHRGYHQDPRGGRALRRHWRGRTAP